MIIRAQYFPGMLLQPGDLYCGRGRGRTHLHSGLDLACAERSAGY
jgi:hypothetical protein